MKVVTFNINGINGRLALLLRWLEKESPDVVCLQESWVTALAFHPKKAVVATGHDDGVVRAGGPATAGEAVEQRRGRGR